MLRAEDGAGGEGFLENGKMWSISMDLSPGRVEERSGRWGGVHVSSGSPPVSHSTLVTKHGIKYPFSLEDPSRGGLELLAVF